MTRRPALVDDELDAAILQALEAGPLSKERIREAVRGAPGRVRAAIDRLLARGEVVLLPGRKHPLLALPFNRTFASPIVITSLLAPVITTEQMPATVTVPADFLERFTEIATRQAQQLNALLSALGIVDDESTAIWDAWERDKPGNFAVWVSEQLYRHRHLTVAQADEQLN